jgi:hypothetical protein
VFDVTGRREIATYSTHGEKFGDLSPDAEFVSTISDNDMVHVWKPRDDSPVGSFQENGGIQKVVTLSPSRVVSVSRDGRARLWNAEESKKMLELGRYVVSSPDAKSLISVGEKPQLWDVAGARPLTELMVENLAEAFFLGDGRFLTIDRRASENKSILQVWDSSGRLVDNLLEQRRSAHYRIAWLQRPFVLLQSDEQTFAWSDRSLPALAVRGNAIALSFDRQAAIIQLPPVLEPILVRAFSDPQDAVNHTMESVPRCLTRSQREQFFLDAGPPRWCITGAAHLEDKDPARWTGKWPYQSRDWRLWLAAKDRGEDLPQPQSSDFKIPPK